MAAMRDSVIAVKLPIKTRAADVEEDDADLNF